MRQETSVTPTRLCYFLLALTLTGILASLEANRSFSSQQRFDNQQPVRSIWSHVDFVNRVNSSPYNSESSF